MPKLSSISRAPNQSRAKLERAAFSLRTGQFPEAERLAAEILKSSRTDNAAAEILARALIAQNRFEDAIPTLEAAARRSDNPVIETLLGAALGSAGRGAEAIERLRTATARRPAFLPAFQELAGQFAKAGRIDEAIAVIESGLALQGASVDLQLDLARLHAYRNERGKARAILLAARDAEPGRPEILKEFARVLLLDGDYAAAAEACRHALGLRPDDAMARADLAACLLEMGEREAAEAALRLAVRGRPQMLGRTTYALAAASHGRFFFRPSAMARFLQRDGG